MRILMLSDFYLPALGGVEQHVQGLSESLARRGHEVAVATLRLEGTAARECHHGVSIHRIRGTAQRLEWLFKHPGRTWAPPVPDPELTRALRQIVREERPDIVHGHDWLARSFVPFKRWSGAAYVLTLHYYTASCARKDLLYQDNVCAGPAARKCLNCAAHHYGLLKGPTVAAGNWLGGAVERAVVDGVIAVSAATAIGNGLMDHGVRYDVIPNFIAEADEQDDADDASYLAQLPDDDFILFVGDVRAAKGIDVLIAAYAELSHPPPLVLVGKVWSDTPVSLPDGVRLLGPWPNRAVRAAWRRARFGIVPSVWPEPFGIVLIEAMVSGCPVIASRIGGIPEVVVDGETGILVPPRDPTALRAAMERLLSERDVRDRMGDAARRHAFHFREDAVVPRIERVYKGALSRRSALSGLPAITE
jgi:glycosyltransferase involved in cell wall biosynthesis